MKKIKSSVFALLSATALLFSSCLGDSNYTPSIGCTGSPTFGMGSEVLLDNGVVVSLSGVDPTALMDIDRIFVYGQVTGENTDLQNIKPGDKVSIIPQVAVEMEAIKKIEEEEFADKNLTEVETLNWFTFDYQYNAINGYMNFSITGDCYSKKNSNTEDNKSDSYTLVEPYYYIAVTRIDAQAKIVDLLFGYDNRKSECAGEDGKPKEGYAINQNVALPPLYFNTTSLYRELDEAGLSDDDTITFNVYTASKDKETGKIEKEQISLSNVAIQKLLLKRTYGGGY